MNIFNKVISYSTAILLTAGCISADIVSYSYNSNTVFAANDKASVISVTINDFVYELDTLNSTCTLADMTKTEKNIKIPESIEINGKKYNVTYIGHDFFIKLNGIESIYFPKTIVSLPEDDFKNISSIPKATMDSENEDYCIENNILYSKNMLEIVGCFNKTITDLTIPNTVKKINKYAFFNCTALKTISIPPSVTDFGESAFSNCTSLKLVDFEQGEEPTAFPSDPTLFENCKFYFNSYKGETGKTLTKYKNYYEDKCHYEDENKTVLTRYIGNDSSFTVPDTVKIIDVAAFTMNDTLTEIVLPSSLEKINASAFSKCTNLLKINIPNSVTNIENFAFAECINLQDVKLSEKLTSIPTFCFYNCENLETLYIPDSVTEIQSLAFNSDDLIMKIVYGGTKLQWNNLMNNLKTGNESLLYSDIEMVFEGDKPVLPGDINGDGCVNAADFTELTNYILYSEKLATRLEKNADINSDGKISVSDLASLKIILIDSGYSSSIRVDKPHAN